MAHIVLWSYHWFTYFCNSLVGVDSDIEFAVESYDGELRQMLVGQWLPMCISMIMCMLLSDNSSINSLTIVMCRFFQLNVRQLIDRLTQNLYISIAEHLYYSKACASQHCLLKLNILNIHLDSRVLTFESVCFVEAKPLPWFPESEKKITCCNSITNSKRTGGCLARQASLVIPEINKSLWVILKLTERSVRCVVP